MKTLLKITKMLGAIVGGSTVVVVAAITLKGSAPSAASADVVPIDKTAGLHPKGGTDADMIPIDTKGGPTVVGVPSLIDWKPGMQLADTVADDAPEDMARSVEYRSKGVAGLPDTTYTISGVRDYGRADVKIYRATVGIITQYGPVSTDAGHVIVDCHARTEYFLKDTKAAEHGEVLRTVDFVVPVKLDNANAVAQFGQVCGEVVDMSGIKAPAPAPAQEHAAASNPFAEAFDAAPPQMQRAVTETLNAGRDSIVSCVYDTENQVGATDVNTLRTWATRANCTGSFDAAMAQAFGLLDLDWDERAQAAAVTVRTKYLEEAIGRAVAAQVRRNADARATRSAF